MGAPPKAVAQMKKTKKNEAKGGPRVSQASRKQFKPNNKSRDVAKQERKQQHLLPVRIEEDVPDFPRGKENYGFIVVSD